MWGPRWHWPSVFVGAALIEIVTGDWPAWWLLPIWSAALTYVTVLAVIKELK